MPTSPHYEAQLEKGRQLLADQFEAWNLSDPRQRAEHVVRRLRTELDWGPPRTAADQPLPAFRGPSSTERGRAEARALYQRIRQERPAATDQP